MFQLDVRVEVQEVAPAVRSVTLMVIGCVRFCALRVNGEAEYGAKLLCMLHHTSCYR